MRFCAEMRNDFIQTHRVKDNESLLFIRYDLRNNITDSFINILLTQILYKRAAPRLSRSFPFAGVTTSLGVSRCPLEYVSARSFYAFIFKYPDLLINQVYHSFIYFCIPIFIFFHSISDRVLFSVCSTSRVIAAAYY